MSHDLDISNDFAGKAALSPFIRIAQFLAHDRLPLQGSCSLPVSRSSHTYYNHVILNIPFFTTAMNLARLNCKRPLT